MTASTSAMAYREIEADGTAHLQKEQIIRALMIAFGGMTRRELSAMTGIEPGAVGGRVNALIAEKKLNDDGDKRRCRITGKLVKEVRLAHWVMA